MLSQTLQHVIVAPEVCIDPHLSKQQVVLLTAQVSVNSLLQNAVRIRIGPQEAKYFGGAVTQQLLDDLAKRFGSGRLLTSDGVVVQTANLPPGIQDLIYGPHLVLLPVEFSFRFLTIDEEVYEETVKLRDQSDLTRLRKSFGVASFRAVGSTGPSSMSLEDIKPGQIYDLNPAGRRVYDSDTHASDALGDGEDDKLGEAMLKVFGKEEGVVDAYLFPVMRRFMIAEHEPHHGETDANQEWDAAVVVTREHEKELLLGEHKERLVSTDIEDVALRLQRAAERAKDPNRGECIGRWWPTTGSEPCAARSQIPPEEKEKVKRASEEYGVPVLLEDGSDLNVGSALLDLHGD